MCQLWAEKERKKERERKRARDRDRERQRRPTEQYPLYKRSVNVRQNRTDWIGLWSLKFSIEL